MTFFFSSCLLEVHDQVRFSNTMPFYHKKVSLKVGSMKRKLNSFEMYTFNMFVNISVTTQKKSFSKLNMEVTCNFFSVSCFNDFFVGGGGLLYPQHFNTTKNLHLDGRWI